MLNTLLAIGVAGIYVAAAYCAWRAVLQARTAQGAMGWVILLAAAPFLGVPAFVVFGQARYATAVSRRRRLRSAIERLRLVTADAADTGPAATDQPELRVFERLAASRFLPSNDARLLVDGRLTFPEIFSAIETARSYVLVSTYILRDDEIGRALADRLIDRAQAGCRVHLLYDDLGSGGLGQAYIAALEAAGVQIMAFNPNGWLTGWFHLNFRNHRKIVVVDGRVAFTGGLNFGEEYLDGTPVLGAWRDTHAMFRGPIVSEIQQAFAEDWLEQTGHELPLHWGPVPPAGGYEALALATGPADRLESGSLYFINAAQCARERLWIASAYFVPDTDILSALKLAALRGVDVRLLVPLRPDHRFVWLAAFAYFDEVREAGVRIFRYHAGFMHQKVLLVDDHLASVGSLNLDNRSCRLNFELTVLVRDTAFAAEVEKMLEDDFARATELTQPLAAQDSPLIRYGAHFARLFAPVL